MTQIFNPQLEKKKERGCGFLLQGVGEGRKSFLPHHLCYARLQPRRNLYNGDICECRGVALH